MSKQHHLAIGRAVLPGLLAIGLLATSASAQSDTEEAGGSTRYFALPFELDLDSGADNGDASFLKFAPLYKIKLGENWSLINMTLLTLADAPGGVPGRPGNPNPLPGDREFGFADLTHASFFTPPAKGNFTFGFGVLLTAPSATDDVLGSGKWSAGPAARVVYRKGPWNVGFFGGNYRSFAGSGARFDVNQLLIRGAIRRDLPNDWFFVSAPVITANWNGKSGQRWVVPVGGGLGKQIGVGSIPWTVSMQGYVNAVKPDGAPDWSVRLSVVVAIPLDQV